jgi:hypothetical protein
MLDVNKLNTDNLKEKTYSLNQFFPFYFFEVEISSKDQK